MNRTTSPAKRDTGKLIAKNLVILVVLITVCSLSIWAWFSQNQEATANGISIKAKASGVQVSWDGISYYDNLTATNQSEVTNQIGMAKYFNDDKSAYGLKLITGDGLSFFEPYLNRRTGEHITDSTGAWSGIQITDSNSHGRYIDVELHFKSDRANTVYLAKDSSANPKNIVDRISEYGDFSRDNIASASRVAFLDSEKENVNLIWAPNANKKLTESENGYTRVTEKKTENIESEEGDYKLNGGVEKPTGETYYLWTLFDDELVDTYAKAQNTNYLEPRVMEYNSKIKYYTTNVKLYVPTYYTNTPSIPLLISTTNSQSELSNADQLNIDGQKSNAISNVKQKFYISNQTFILDENTDKKVTATCIMYPESQVIYSGLYMDMILGYNPETHILTILKYTAKDLSTDKIVHEFDLGINDTTTTVTPFDFYEIDNNSKCTLVNQNSTVAFSSAEHYVKSIHFKKDSNKENVLPISVTLQELFTAEKDGVSYNATYKFKNGKEGTYLSVAGGVVSLNDSGSSFKLTYIEGVGSPVLESTDGYCLIYFDGKMAAVPKADLDISTVVTLYTGISYEFITDPVLEEYKYYSFDNKTLVNLTPNPAIDSTTFPKLYTTNADEKSTESIGPALLTLTKVKETDEFYTGKLVMRIWVEGTDREAKTPLADGIFDLSIHFTSQ